MLTSQPLQMQFYRLNNSCYRIQHEFTYDKGLETTQRDKYRLMYILILKIKSIQELGIHTDK
ncbi:MAG TPA: hypothetical protein VJP58_10415 [Candidatus Nitrosocosmicus sp.]|nr:hypothetical protein [Candidatus Nitrosocosmicus sp.]